MIEPLASLGTFSGTSHTVLCAWLSRDGSRCWYFDESGALHRLQLSPWQIDSWPLLTGRWNGPDAVFSAQFAGIDEPFFWLSQGVAEQERSYVTVYALGDRGPVERRVFPFDREAQRGPNGVGARCSAVIVHETEGAQVANVFQPDGTPIAKRPASIVDATRAGYWLQNERRFTFHAHDDGRTLASFELSEDSYARSLGTPTDTQLAVLQYDAATLLDAAGSVVKVTTATPQTRAIEFFRGSMSCPQARADSTALVFATSDGFALQRWSEANVERLAFTVTMDLRWIDEHRIVATRFGHVFVFDRASETLVHGDCPPIEQIAFTSLDQPIVVQHTGALVRWWDARSQSVIAEDHSPAVLERMLIGLRAGGTSALSIETARSSRRSLVEWVLDGSTPRERWRHEFGPEIQECNVAAFDDERALVFVGDRVSAMSALLFERGAARAIGDLRWFAQGRLAHEDGELVIERVEEITFDRDPRSVRWLRERFDATGSRTSVTVYETSEERGESEVCEDGCVRVDRAANHVRFALRDGSAIQYLVAPLGEDVIQSNAVARRRMRCVVVHADERSVSVVDAREGVVFTGDVVAENERISAVAISANGAHFAVGTTSGRVLVFLCRAKSGIAVAPLR